MSQINPMSPAILVLTTVPDAETAEAIARSILSERLAACISELPIQSTYRWEGEVLREREIQLLIKTQRDRYAELEAHLRSIHPYEVPEILAIAIEAGSNRYLNWIHAQLG